MNPYYWGIPVRVELGANVVKAFTSPKRFLEASPKPGNLLLPYTENLQEQLRKDGKFLPSIQYDVNPRLKPNFFRVIYGLNDDLSEAVNANDVINALASVAWHYELSELPSVDEVKRLTREGNDFLSKGNYGKAIKAYDKAYYWTLIIREHDTIEVLITALFNAGYIYYINNRLPDALDCTVALCDIVDSRDFHDPVMRYHTHMFRANLLWSNEEFSDALPMFQKCINDIEYANQPELMMLALWDLVCAYFAMNLQNDEACLSSLYLMKNLAESHENIFSAGQKVTILNMIATVQNNIIAQLQTENRNLRSRCDDLEKKLSPRVAIGNAVRSVSGVLMTISAFLPRQMSFVKTVGKLVVSGNTFNDEARVIDNLYDVGER